MPSIPPFVALALDAEIPVEIWMSCYCCHGCHPFSKSWLANCDVCKVTSPFPAQFPVVSNHCPPNPVPQGSIHSRLPASIAQLGQLAHSSQPSSAACPPVLSSIFPPTNLDNTLSLGMANLQGQPVAQIPSGDGQNQSHLSQQTIYAIPLPNGGYQLATLGPTSPPASGLPQMMMLQPTDTVLPLGTAGNAQHLHPLSGMQNPAQVMADQTAAPAVPGNQIPIIPPSDQNPVPLSLASGSDLVAQNQSLNAAALGFVQQVMSTPGGLAMLTNMPAGQGDAHTVPINLLRLLLYWSFDVSPVCI
eukprot:gene4738-863_t